MATVLANFTGALTQTLDVGRIIESKLYFLQELQELGLIELSFTWGVP
jgi:hypothetical protein